MTSEPLSNEKWKHRAKTETLWDKYASIYDKLVTYTANRMLRIYITQEQEMLDQYLTWLASRFPEKKISLLEIGSGTGRTLLYYARKPALIERMEYLIGIDEAPAMCETAYHKLATYVESNRNGNNSNLYSKYSFLNLRAEGLLRYFNCGRVERDGLDLISKRKIGATFSEKKYNESIKVVINMLNTLGVIRSTRSKVVRNMVRAAGYDGRIVVSVFNGSAFAKYAEGIYMSIRNIVGKFDSNDFDYTKTEFAPKFYYSHWFTRTEIEGLMRKEGCTNVRTKEIDNIGLFVTSEIGR